MKNNDFDFIKDKFDNDNITAPDSLSEAVAREIIDSKEPKKIKLYKRKGFKAAVSLVACIAIVLSCISVVNHGASLRYSTRTEPVTSSTGDIKAFSSYDEIEKKIKAANKVSLISYDIFSYTYKNEMHDADSATATSAESNSASDKSTHGTTYLQVDGVDEADILKNDGRYIYFVSPYENVIKIYEANGLNPELVASIKDFDKTVKNSVYLYDGYPEFEEMINELYLVGDKLIVNTTSEIQDINDYKIETIARSYVYDVADKSNIKMLKSFEQSGRYISSRMIDNMLYIVSNYYCDYEESTEIEDCIPSISINNGKKEKVPCTDIYYDDDCDESSFLVVSAIDVENGKKASDTKAVFGAGGDIYCNEDNLYIAMNEYNRMGSSIKIFKLSLGEKIKIDSAVELPGSINDQFSMDEHNGYFRVATTSENYNKVKDEFTVVNNLFVLNDKLERVGAVRNFAKNESIQAVKFMGDMAYVITYENTDPLFVIDLAKPDEPKILGSVEIEGFSSQLVPVGDDMLLGIGYHEREMKYEFETGLKLVLFDVSDKVNPKVLDTAIFKDAYSHAQYNHKAILVNEEKGYYAIDLEQYSYNKKGNEFYADGVLTFKVEGKKIIAENSFNYRIGVSYRSSKEAQRCTFVDDVIYVFDAAGTAYAFEYK